MFEKLGNSKNRSSKNPGNLNGALKADSRDQENNSKIRGIRIIHGSKNQGWTVLSKIRSQTFYKPVDVHFVTNAIGESIFQKASGILCIS